MTTEPSEAPAGCVSPGPELHQQRQVAESFGEDPERYDRTLDTRTPDQLEAALKVAAKAVAKASDFAIVGHRLELVGRCGNCR